MEDLEVVPLECLTSLEDSETKPHPLRLQSTPQYRIHAPVQSLRTRTICLFWDSNDPRLTKRAEKMGACCVSPTVYVGKGCKPTCSPGRCRDRMCPTCAIHRSQTLHARIGGLTTRARSIRQVELTMPMTKDDLGTRVDNLLACMRRLRAMKRWRERVKGGVFVIEATRGAKDTHWHVHAHLLIEGEYYSFDALKSDWSSAVGQTANVWIQAVHDRTKAARYVTKYLSKGTDVEEWTDEQLVEYGLLMHRRRVVGTFGTWHRCKLHDLDENAPKPPRASHALSFAYLEGCIVTNSCNLASAAPLLSRLSRTWRLLMHAHTGKVEFDPTPLEPADFEELTDVLLAFTETVPVSAPSPAAPKPPPPPRLFPDDTSYR